MPRYYLGIDGGQSSTTALIANESGAVVGHGRSGPCNHVTGTEARDKFRRVIGDCIAQASAKIDTGGEFAAACLGFSGGAEDKLAYAREWIQSARLKVTNDAEIALTGAHEAQPGIIIIAGTGSIAFGRNAAGRMARAGGWGYVYGDEGGAFDLVRRALRAALQWEEGWGAETALHGALLAATEQPTANALLHSLYTRPRHEAAKLAVLVTKCANNGDRVAAAILDEAAASLALYVNGVQRNLFEAGESAPIAYIGGVFQSEPLLRAFTYRMLAMHGCHAMPPKLSPAAGALLEALRLDGNDATLTNVPETKT